MAQASVKTVQYMDPRIEPQPDPVYDYVIGPTQNQYYKIPASGLSDSSITFNNLTTLGVDRAYLDTFELEITAEITFNVKKYLVNNHVISKGDIANDDGFLVPRPSDWTFDSFPFNKCCEEARVNINGGAFFSQPMSYIRAKERYMNQYELSKCYENICPCHKPLGQYESGRCGVDSVDGRVTATAAQNRLKYGATNVGANPAVNDVDVSGYEERGFPSRLAYSRGTVNQSDQGLEGGFNNSILRSGAVLTQGDGAGAVAYGYENYKVIHNADNSFSTQVTVTWREPVFCSPFSSRYDGTYGRPLYNITSMDLSFTLQNLGNMIRISQIYSTTYGFVDSYNITIRKCQLCYQVMTIPPILNKPLTTLVPYRRFVPYVTDYNTYAGRSNQDRNAQAMISGASPTTIEITSGVYTLNEVPTAIWVFCGPNKEMLQTNPASNNPGNWVGPGAQGNTGLNDQTSPNMLDPAYSGNWDSNKQFAFLEHLDISLANTTQILNTAEQYDLYRIAKANGCEDSFYSWGVWDGVLQSAFDYKPANAAPDGIKYGKVQRMYNNCGSVIRLKPGVDLIVPDQPLIPGANANNMVLQVRGKFTVPPHCDGVNKYALWLLFEYVGVAAISPGQCEITMNPLGSGEVMAVSPVMSATSDATEGNLEGSGFWDGVKKVARIAAQIGDSGVISKILKKIPGASGVGDYMEKHGFGMGEPATKRNRSGGAVMGRGLNDWV